MRFVVVNSILALTVSLDDIQNLLEGGMHTAEAPDNTVCLIGMFEGNSDPRTTHPVTCNKVETLIGLSHNDLSLLGEKAFCKLVVDKLGELMVIYEPAFLSYAAAKGMRKVTVGTPVSTSIN